MIELYATGLEFSKRLDGVHLSPHLSRLRVYVLFFFWKKKMKYLELEERWETSAGRRGRRDD